MNKNRKDQSSPTAPHAVYRHPAQPADPHSARHPAQPADPHPDYRKPAQTADPRSAYQHPSQPADPHSARHPAQPADPRSAYQRPTQPQYPNPAYPHTAQHPYPPQSGYPPPEIYRAPGRQRPARRRRSCCLLPGCLTLLLMLVCLGIVMAGYLLFPGRTNLLIFGVDWVDPAVPGTQARSDTIMLATVDPVNSYIGLLSVPRDLWVKIPGFGENRINTAHYFAETQQIGSGPDKLLETVRQNFGIPLQYYMRLRFEGFLWVIDQMGGVDLELDKPMAGYPAGVHHLKARKALGFVRDRSGSDDFFRMQQGQVMFKSMIKTMSRPEKWPRIPAVLRASLRAVDTNIPLWTWPRLALSFLWIGPGGIDSQIISREMVTPFTTDQGAQVLLPNWQLINPLVQQMFFR